jgi:hypothetical protein
LNDRIINEEQLGKDIEGSGDGPVEVTMPTFAWRD